MTAANKNKKVTKSSCMLFIHVHYLCSMGLVIWAWQIREGYVMTGKTRSGSKCGAQKLNTRPKRRKSDALLRVLVWTQRMTEAMDSSQKSQVRGETVSQEERLKYFGISFKNTVWDWQIDQVNSVTVLIPVCGDEADEALFTGLHLSSWSIDMVWAP